MSRLFAMIAGSGIVLLVFGFLLRPPGAPAFDPAVCAGEPLTGVEQIEKAMEEGYEIDRSRRCITRASFEAVTQQRAAWEEARKVKAAEKEAKRAAARGGRAPTLKEAREEFQTAISVPPANPLPLPQPPKQLFLRTDYPSGKGRYLSAFVTPDPKDGRRHPAIVWLTGGDTSSLDDFWTPGPAGNDQSARTFREAGVVMMFPTLRGGNENGGAREYFYGEVNDVLNAASHLAGLAYVDPEQIYLGGHSTGGTLALLTAEAGGPFKGVFAFGPVAEVTAYPTSLIPVEFSRHDPRERQLRSPLHWLAGIKSPTWVIEGAEGPGNLADLKQLCLESRNPQLHCLEIPGHNHFSVLEPVTRAISARVALAAEGLTFSLEAAEFAAGPRAVTPAKAGNGAD